MAHFWGLLITDLLIDDAGTPGDPTDDAFLPVLDTTSHGNLDAPVLCELARQYAPRRHQDDRLDDTHRRTDIRTLEFRASQRRSRRKNHAAYEVSHREMPPSSP